MKDKIKRIICRLIGHKTNREIVIKRVYKAKRKTNDKLYFVGIRTTCARCGFTKVKWCKGYFTKKEIKDNLNYNVNF